VLFVFVGRCLYFCCLVSNIIDYLFIKKKKKLNVILGLNKFAHKDRLNFFKTLLYIYIIYIVTLENLKVFC